MSTIDTIRPPESMTKLLLAGVLALNCVPGSAEAGPNQPRGEISHVLKLTNGEADGQQGAILDGGETSIESVYPNAIPAGDHCHVASNYIIKLVNGALVIPTEGQPDVKEGGKTAEQFFEEAKAYVAEDRDRIGICLDLGHWEYGVIGKAEDYRKGEYTIEMRKISLCGIKGPCK